MNEQHLENVIEGALLAHRSAIWWQEEMNKALADLYKLEEEDPYDTLQSEEKAELEGRIEYLIVKGQWEDNNLEKVMSQLNPFSIIEKKHAIAEIHKRWALEKSQNDASLPPESL